LMKNARVPSYETLMARFQARLDSDAFEQIVSFYINPALAVARQILLDDTLAEDAVQESFLRVIRKREQYIPGNPFSCWFYAIVRNVCVDMLRKLTREKEALENAATSSLGRCLASFGLHGTEFASAEEVGNAILNQNNKLPKERYYDISGRNYRDLLRIRHASDRRADRFH